MSSGGCMHSGLGLEWLGQKLYLCVELQKPLPRATRSHEQGVRSYCSTSLVVELKGILALLVCVTRHLTLILLCISFS